MSLRYSLCELCAQRQGRQVHFSIVRAGDCFVCHGLTSRIESMKRRALRAIVRHQFKTFSIGMIVPADIQEREDRIRSELKIRGEETTKSQLSRMIAEAVRRGTHRRPDRLRPDITILVNAAESGVNIQSRPVFVYGRYTKPRGIPQRRYFCEGCNGRGCDSCSGSGYEQVPSVESVVGSRLNRLMGSTRTKFTWLGSEDAESLVFPPGRPFVVELKSPVKREAPSRLNLRTGKGLLRVSGLRVLAGRPARLPGFALKTRITVGGAEKVSKEKLREMRKKMEGVRVQFESSKGRMVYKKIHEIRTKAIGKKLVADVKMDGGLPVKRFVSGESVSPSLSEFLRTPLICQRFDILRVWETGRFEFGEI